MNIRPSIEFQSIGSAFFLLLRGRSQRYSMLSCASNAEKVDYNPDLGDLRGHGEIVVIPSLYSRYCIDRRRGRSLVLRISCFDCESWVPTVVDSAWGREPIFQQVRSQQV